MNARTTQLRTVGFLLVALSLAACTDGKDGTAGDPGAPGPEGEGAARPRIDTLAPPVGSLRNVVFLTGTSFSAVLDENEVRFGGAEATVTAATATTLTVLPPFGLAPGYAPVTVTVGDNVSAPVGFTLVASGTSLPSRVAAPRSPGKPVELDDGRILIPDADDGSILVLETDGTMRELARGQGLVFPQRLIEAPDGSVLVFDASSGGILRVDPDTGVVEVEHWGVPYLAGSHDAAGNLFAYRLNGGIDRIEPDGTVTADWCSPGGTAVTDVQVIGGDVYAGVLAMVGPSSVVKCSTAASGAPTPVALVGITSIGALAAAGTDLLATGTFDATNGQQGVVRIAANGAITPVTTDAAGEGRYAVLGGAILLQGGDYLLTDRNLGFVGELSGTALTIRAGAIAGTGASLRVAGKTYSSAHRGAFTPGWIVESSDDGASRILAQGSFAQIIAGADETTLVALRTGELDVASVDLATGAVTSLFSVAGELAMPNALARDGAGNWYVSEKTVGTIRKYDTAGTVIGGVFATEPDVVSLHVQDAALIALDPVAGRAERISTADGTVTPWLASAAGVSPYFLFRESDESVARDLIADPAGNRIVDVDAYGFVADFAGGLPGASSIAQREDGMLVVRCADGPRLLTP